ncbi:MAG: hypothetical protein ACRDTV_17155, partial [Mycobacterium sp.]
MTVDPRARSDWTAFARADDIPDWITNVYTDSYGGPHGDAAGPDRPAELVGPALLSAHYRLGRHRPAGESRVAVYPADDPAGFGPALQVVTDHGILLMDSVTVLLHRLGMAYVAIMTP